MIIEFETQKGITIIGYFPDQIAIEEKIAIQSILDNINEKSEASSNFKASESVSHEKSNIPICEDSVFFVSAFENLVIDSIFAKSCYLGQNSSIEFDKISASSDFLFTTSL